MSDEQPRRPSVFGAVDQAEIISRIDAVGDDDLSSCFFGDSLQDVENAATRVFDIGVHEDSVTPDEVGPGPFAPPGPSTQGAGTTGETNPKKAASAHGGLDADAAARQAFILGGPGAIRGD